MSKPDATNNKTTKLPRTVVQITIYVHGQHVCKEYVAYIKGVIEESSLEVGRRMVGIDLGDKRINRRTGKLPIDWSYLCVYLQIAMVEFKRRQRKKKVETRNYSKNTEPCDVFINHRGSDTKKNIAGLLYEHLSRLGIKPFMDSRNMKPGDKLFDEIDAAIRNCKVAVALLSPNYCESRHCLHELALLMESNKRVLPIFWDVKPSKLLVNNINERQFSDKELRRFKRALEQVKNTVGVTFDSFKGYNISFYFYVFSFSFSFFFPLEL